MNEILDTYLSDQRNKDLQKVLSRASLTAAIRTMSVGGRITGAEREVHEFSARCDGQHVDSTSGILWRLSDLRPRRRDMSVNVFGQGGATVQTQVDPHPIAPLLNSTTVERLGANIIRARSSLAITAAAKWHIHMCALNAKHLISERSKRAKYWKSYREIPINVPHDPYPYWVREVAGNYLELVKKMIPEISPPPL